MARRMAISIGTAETFTPDETRALAPYFTNTDRPVFATITGLRGVTRHATS